jgi:hypothetical protein
MNTRPLSKEHIDKRLLVSSYSVSLMTNPVEAKVYEVSPSGMYARIEIRREDGTFYTKWCLVNDYEVLEELKEEARVNEQWLRELHEKEERDREDFKKYSSPTSKPSYWDSLPTSVCSSDYANAPDFHATNHYKEQVDDAIKNLDDETVRKAFNKACKMSGLDIHAAKEEVKKNKWVHGVCNPSANDAKEYVKDCKSTGERYNSVDEMIKGMMKKEQVNKLGLQSSEKIKASDLPGWGKHDKI